MPRLASGSSQACWPPSGSSPSRTACSGCPPSGGVEAAAGFVVLLASVRRLLPSGALTFRRGLPSSVMMRGVIASAFFAAEVFVPLAMVETRGLTTTAGRPDPRDRCRHVVGRLVHPEPAAGRSRPGTGRPTRRGHRRDRTAHPAPVGADRPAALDRGALVGGVRVRHGAGRPLGLRAGHAAVAGGRPGRQLVGDPDRRLRPQRRGDLPARPGPRDRRGGRGSDGGHVRPHLDGAQPLSPGSGVLLAGRMRPAPSRL